MKQLMIALGLGMAASWATAAGVTSKNTFGIVCIPSRAAETVIAVPWTAVGGEDVAVADYVKTATLTAGDMLHAYDATVKKFKSWVLDENKTWKGATSVTTEGLSWTAGGADSTLARGDSLILVRQNTAADIFLYGELTTEAAPVSTVAAGTMEGIVYNLITSPLAEDVNLNDIVMTGTPNGYDLIRLDTMTGLTYKNGSWGRSTYNPATHTSTFDTTCAVIKAGTGFVYQSRGGAPTFNWSERKGADQ